MVEIRVVNSFLMPDIILMKEEKELELKKDIKQIEFVTFVAEGVEIFIPEQIDTAGLSYINRYYFKNQKIDYNKSIVGNFLVYINFIGYRAMDVLELNRNKIKKDFIKKNEENIVRAIIKYINQQFLYKYKSLSEMMNLSISMFFNNYRDCVEKIFGKNVIDKFIYKFVKEYNFGLKDSVKKRISIKEILKNKETEFVIYSKNYGYNYKVDKAGKAYIFHPLKVRWNVSGYKYKVVALLHDIVEDTDYTIDDLKKFGFSNDIIEAIQCLTKDRKTKYDDYINRIKKCEITRKVKIEDITHNMDLKCLKIVEEKDLKRVEKYKGSLEKLLNNNSVIG
ncbi:hypothetical protein [Fusobacterium sp. PH5-44]|uniref:hypothetical protein n=1 Tax=unclassified Fusobacterium TaxID=2648384 RepID=UPI003D1FDC4D